MRETMKRKARINPHKTKNFNWLQIKLPKNSTSIIFQNCPNKSNPPSTGPKTTLLFPNGEFAIFNYYFPIDSASLTPHQRSRRERKREQRRKRAAMSHLEGENGNEFERRASPTYEPFESNSIYSSGSSSSEDEKVEDLQQIIITQQTGKNVTKKYPSDFLITQSVASVPTSTSNNANSSNPSYFVGVKEVCIVRDPRDRWEFAKEMDRKYNHSFNTLPASSSIKFLFLLHICSWSYYLFYYFIFFLFFFSFFCFGNFLKYEN